MILSGELRVCRKARHVNEQASPAEAKHNILSWRSVGRRSIFGSTTELKLPCYPRQSRKGAQCTSSLLS